MLPVFASLSLLNKRMVLVLITLTKYGAPSANAPSIISGSLGSLNDPIPTDGFPLFL